MREKKHEEDNDNEDVRVHCLMCMVWALLLACLHWYPKNYILSNTTPTKNGGFFHSTYLLRTIK